MVVRALVTATIVAVLECISVAQGFREHNQSAAPRIRELVKSAEALGVSVPDLNADEEGYYLVFAAWANNVDIILLTSPTIDQSELEAVAVQIAGDLKWPSADFIRRERPKIRYVDIELNDSIERSGDRWQERQTFDFPVGDVCAALRRSSLGTKPWVVFIDSDGPDQCTLSGQGVPLDPKHGAVIPLSQVDRGARLRTSTTIHWYHRLLGYACPAIMLLLIGLPLVTSFRTQRRHIEQRRQQTEALSAEARQELYNMNAKSLGFTQFLPLLMLLPVFTMTVFKDQTSKFMLKSLSGNPWISAWMQLPMAIQALTVLGPVLLSLLLSGLFRKKLGRELRLPKAEEDQVPAPLRKMLLVLMLWLPLMLGLTMIPGFRTLSPDVRRAILIGPPILFMLALPLVIRRSLLGKRTTLSPGDRWHDEVTALAASAGVKVRSVQISDLDKANAFATVNGSIVFTKALLEQLSPVEVRAIAAHEVAHLKYRHPGRQLALSLAIFAVLFTLNAVLQATVPTDSALGRLVRVPILIWLAIPLISLLWLNPRSRRHEFDADRDSVTITGDPDALIRALLKIADTNRDVHELAPLDQRFATHPSIKRRIEALRLSFPGAGAFLTEHPSGALVEAQPPGTDQVGS